MKIIILFCFVVVFPFISKGQTIVHLQVNQPKRLTADAGSDRSIYARESTKLGQANTASGGTSPYSFFWSPSSYLNDSTVANPMAILDTTTIFNLIVIDKNGCSDTSTVKINLLSNSIKNTEKPNWLNIYPNPSIGYVIVKISNNDINLSEIRLFSSTGSLIWDEEINKNRYVQKINIPDKGIYFINIRGKGVNYTESIISK